MKNLKLNGQKLSQVEKRQRKNEKSNTKIL